MAPGPARHRWRDQRPGIDIGDERFVEALEADQDLCPATHPSWLLLFAEKLQRPNPGDEIRIVSDVGSEVEEILRPVR